MMSIFVFTIEKLLEKLFARTESLKMEGGGEHEGQHSHDGESTEREGKGRETWIKGAIGKFSGTHKDDPLRP